MTVFLFPKGIQAMPRRGPKSVWSGCCSARFSDVLPKFSLPTCSNCPMGRPEAPVVPTKFSREAALVPAARIRPLLKSKPPMWLYLSVIRLLYSYRRPSVTVRLGRIFQRSWAKKSYSVPVPEMYPEEPRIQLVGRPNWASATPLPKPQLGGGHAVKSSV